MRRRVAYPKHPQNLHDLGVEQRLRQATELNRGQPPEGVAEGGRVEIRDQLPHLAQAENPPGVLDSGCSAVHTTGVALIRDREVHSIDLELLEIREHLGVNAQFKKLAHIVFQCGFIDVVLLLEELDQPGEVAIDRGFLHETQDLLPDLVDVIGNSLRAVTREDVLLALVSH